MDGWMYRFTNGPAAGNAFGPLELEPPEEVLVFFLADQLCMADVEDCEQLEGLSVSDDLVRYRRKRMSQMTAEQVARHEFVVRGAEYELAS